MDEKCEYSWCRPIIPRHGWEKIVITSMDRRQRSWVAGWPPLYYQLYKRFFCPPRPICLSLSLILLLQSSPLKADMMFQEEIRVLHIGDRGSICWKAKRFPGESWVRVQVRWWSFKAKRNKAARRLNSLLTMSSIFQSIDHLSVRVAETLV